MNGPPRSVKERWSKRLREMMESLAESQSRAAEVPRPPLTSVHLPGQLDTLGTACFGARRARTAILSCPRSWTCDFTRIC
jgi:hypothetical protein